MSIVYYNRCFKTWLTLSLINRAIEFDDYFRLIKAVENLICADLEYLVDEIVNIKINVQDIHIDDLLANGLVYNVDGGFAITDKAYDLVEYGIHRGHDVRRPKEKLERQIISVITRNVKKQSKTPRF